MKSLTIQFKEMVVMRSCRLAVLAASVLLSVSVSALAEDGQDGPDLSGVTIPGPTAVVDGDTEVIRSVGTNGTAAGPENDGGAGGDISGTGGVYNNTGMTVGVISGGGSGVASSNGSGGDAGDITWSDPSTFISRDFVVASQGGAGHNGGDGGSVVVSVDGQHFRPGETRPLYGGTLVVSRGGDAGNGNQGGDGGDVDVTFTGGTSTLLVESRGGNGTIGGGAGNVDLVLDGEVTYSVYVNAAAGNSPFGSTLEAGDIHVTLKNDANVGGDIIAGPAATAILEFAFTLATEAEFTQAKQAIATSSAATGSVMVNGREYSWTGFTGLKDSLALAMAQNPGAPIAVTVDGGGSSSPSSIGDAFGGAAGTLGGRSSPRSPSIGNLLDQLLSPRKRSTLTVTESPAVVRKLRCDTRLVTVFEMSDGSYSINIRLDDRKAYAVGNIENSKFKRASGSKWRAALGNEGEVVVTEKGEVLATCH